MERDGEVGVHLDGPGDGKVSRPEVIEGRFGRWLRTKAERARIAAESLVPRGVGDGCCATAWDDALADL